MGIRLVVDNQGYSNGRLIEVLSALIHVLLVRNQGSYQIKPVGVKRVYEMLDPVIEAERAVAELVEREVLERKPGLIYLRESAFGAVESLVRLSKDKYSLRIRVRDRDIADMASSLMLELGVEDTKFLSGIRDTLENNIPRIKDISR